MSDGAFTPAARAAIYTAGLGRCAGCGRTDLTTQHRRARGMGGTSDLQIGHPANGVPLCGSGTTGCHGWTEHHRTDALLLGWALDATTPALGSPWWCRAYRGWVAWVMVDGMPMVELRYADLGDIDQHPARMAAVTRLRAARPTGPPISVKATR